MNRFAKVFGCAAVLGAIVGTGIGDAKTAEAQLARPRIKLRLPGVAQSRLRTQVKLRSGRTVSLQQVVDGLEPDQKSRDGSMTAQKMMDDLNAFGDAAKREGVSNDDMKDVVSPDIARKMATARVVNGALLNVVKKPVTKTFNHSYAIGWSVEIGDRDWASAYTSLSLSHNAPNSNKVGCAISFEAGAYLRSTNYPLVKFTADYGATKGAQTQLSANAALYIRGQKTWGASGNTGGTDVFPSHTFAIPSLDLTKKVGPFTAKGKLDMSATLALKPIMKSASTSNTLECTMGVEPSLESKIKGSASVGVSYGELKASAGVKGNLENSVSFPISTSLLVTEKPTLKGRFKAGVDAELMKGEISFYYKVKDVCWDGFLGFDVCMSDIADALSIPMYKEWDIWSSGNEWKPKKPNSSELIECVYAGFGTKDCPFTVNQKPGKVYKETFIDETFPK